MENEKNIPSEFEAISFGDSYGIPESVVRSWYDYSVSNNWCVGGVPIRNWQGALMSWNGRRIKLINIQKRINKGESYGHKKECRPSRFPKGT